MKVGAGSDADTTANAAYVEDSADGKSFNHKDLFPDPYLLFLLVALLFLLYSLLYLAFFVYIYPCLHLHTHLLCFQKAMMREMRSSHFTRVCISASFAKRRGRTRTPAKTAVVKPTRVARSPPRTQMTSALSFATIATLSSLRPRLLQLLSRTLALFAKEPGRAITLA